MGDRSGRAGPCGADAIVSRRSKLGTDGFDHPKKMYDPTEGFIRRGYADSDIELVLGGNFKRALGEIWKA